MHLWQRILKCGVSLKELGREIDDRRLLPLLVAIALIGSHDWVEIAINSGNAQLQLQMQLGDVVEVLV